MRPKDETNEAQVPAGYRRFRMGKLVRDAIPSIFQRQQIRACVRTLDATERLHALKAKLVEEANEVLATASPEELTEELCDVLEVVYAMADSAGIDLQDVEKLRCQKKADNGGFASGFHVDYVDIPKESPKIKRFEAKITQYPECTPSA